MSEKTGMSREVMEWVLEHINYYCPMDREAEEVMSDFVSNMYLENWEAASDQCIQIFHLLGDNFYEHINGTANDRKIVSEYLDAHTYESTKSGIKHPIGCFQGTREELEEKIKNKRSRAVRMDGKIDMEESTKTEEKWILAGMSLVILSLIFWRISVSAIPYKSAALYIFLLLGLLGYVAWRINDNRKCFLEKMIRYYQGMIKDKMTIIVPGGETGQEKMILHRAMPEDFYHKMKKEEGESDIKRIWQKADDWRKRAIQRVPPFGRCIIPLAAVVLLLLVIKTKIEQRRQILLAFTERVKEELVMPGEKTEVSVKQIELAGMGKEKTDNEKPDDEKPEDSFAEEGVIFKDSNERELRMEEIEALKQRTDMDYQEALAYARNEIYARMGYNFGHEGGKYTEHYSQYQWYRDITKKTVTEDMFNQYERANIDLILRMEEELRRQE